jgi:hypothetical protein
MHLVVHVNCPIFLSDFNQIWTLYSFHQVPNMKFHVNPSNGSQADACERTDRHDEASMHFCEYVGVPKNDLHLGGCSLVTSIYLLC